MNEISDQDQFDTLLERSEAFENAIAACFPEAGYALAPANKQHELVATACTIGVVLIGRPMPLGFVVSSLCLSA